MMAMPLPPGDNRADRRDEVADQLARARGLAVLHQTLGHLVEGTAAIENLEQLEQEDDVQDEHHHARHARDDGAVVGEHLVRADRAEHEVEDDAAEVADDERTHQIPALTHHEHHHNREHQQHERPGGAAVEIKAGGDARRP